MLYKRGTPEPRLTHKKSFSRYERDLEHVLWDNQNRAQKLTLWKVDATAFNDAEVAL